MQATVAELSLGPLGWLHPEVEVTLLRAIRSRYRTCRSTRRPDGSRCGSSAIERGVSLTVTDDGVGFPEAGLASAAVPGGLWSACDARTRRRAR